MSVSLQGRSVLVTGGAGFVGSHLVEFLAEQGAMMTVVDNLSTGLRENLRNVDPHQIRFIDRPIDEAIEGLVDDHFDEVFHLAACVGVDLVLQRPAEVIESSLRSARVLLDAATRWQCPVLITSSSEVYGKSTAVPFREDADVVYGPTTATRWSYAYAKGMDEFLALAHGAGEQTPAVIARLFNTVGPRQIGDYGMVLPRFVSAALKDQPLEVYGDGRQIRCFCDVRDVVRGLVGLIRLKDDKRQVFNLGSDEPMAIVDLARLVVEVLGSSSRLEFVPYDRAYDTGFEEIPARIPDLGRIRDAIGFAPTTSLRQTIADMADVMRSTDGPGQSISTGIDSESNSA